MKVTFSNSAQAKEKRIAALPKYAAPVFRSVYKYQALTMIKNFHDGIRNNSLRLYRLANSTIERKRALGMELPATPLYGRGDEEKKRSYINMLRMTELKNGWKVYPSKMKHWSQERVSSRKAMTLEHLNKIHEEGCLIKSKNGFIRIPPRPAVFNAYVKTMKDFKKRDTSRKVKRAIAEYINTGKQGQYVRELEALNRTLSRYRIMDA